jgi:hypothetical protein
MKVMLISSICLIFIILLFIFKKNKIKLLSFSGIEEWTKKYDRLIGLLVSVILVVITGYYAYLTHSMLALSDQQIQMNRELIEQSEKQFKLSQNPIIVIRYLDYFYFGSAWNKKNPNPYKRTWSESDPKSFDDLQKKKMTNKFPFGDYNTFIYKFEIANFSNSTAMDIKFNVNLVTNFKDGRIIKIHSFKGDGVPNLTGKYQYGFYNHIPYMKANQIDTLQVFINGTDYLKLMGYETSEKATELTPNLYDKFYNKIQGMYFEIQCTYANTINQKFKTAGKIQYLAVANDDRNSVQQLGIIDMSNDLEASPIELLEYQKLNSEITGENETAKAFSEYY